MGWDIRGISADTENLPKLVPLETCFHCARDHLSESVPKPDTTLCGLHYPCSVHHWRVYSRLRYSRSWLALRQTPTGQMDPRVYIQVKLLCHINELLPSNRSVDVQVQLLCSNNTMYVPTQ